MITETIPIPSGSAGSAFELRVHRFGRPGARPAVHIQAALHADEIPGMICAVALRERLARREAAGEVLGEIILVPVANPIGLAQEVVGHPLGRFDLADGGNFNRNVPALGEAAARLAGGKLGVDPAANTALLRAALAEALLATPAATPAEHLKKTLLGLALPCDLVLDLHCDAEACMHLYTHTGSVETFAPLAQHLGALAVLVAENSGGDPFDEALSRPWFELAAAFPHQPIPFACHSVTVELRGQVDVSHATAEADAAAIEAFLQEVGVLGGEPPPRPAALCAPTPLAASMPLVAPTGGVLVYRGEVGSRVREGEPLAEIIDPTTGAATVMASPCDGVFFARSALRHVRPGRRIGKVAGVEARRAGRLLSP
jgi:hypothetical protein